MPVYATWNPSDKHADITLSNGDRTATHAGFEENISVRCNISAAGGKWYWEITMGGAPAKANARLGVGTASAPLDAYLGSTAEGYCYYANNGKKVHDGSDAAYGDTYNTGDIIGIALDLDSGKLWFSKNGVWQDSGNPAAGTGEAFSGLSGTFFAMYCDYWTDEACTANFGAAAFTYDVPIGFNSGLYAAGVAAVADAALPALQLLGVGNFFGAMQLPVPTLEGAGGLGAVGSLTLPILTVEGYSGAAPVAITLPAFTVAGIGAVGTIVALTLPALEVDALGGLQGRFDLPALTLAATGTAGEAGSARLTLLMLSVEADGTVLIVGTADLDLAALRLAGTGIVGRVEEIELELPMLEVSADGGPLPVGVADIDLALSVFGSGVANAYRYWGYILEHER